MSEAPEKPKKPKNPHAGHHMRLRKEFQTRGLAGWPDHRVLELLLGYVIKGQDTNVRAHGLIDRFHSLAGVLDAPPEELVKVDGMGPEGATLLKLVQALCVRYQEERCDLGTIVNTPEEAAQHLRSAFLGARQEMVYILCLDSKRKVLGVRKVSEGSIYASDINIRRIAEEALGLRAAALYLAHNHISNLALPSAADWRATEVVRSALSMVGLELIDHLIFVDGDFVSLNESQKGGRRPAYQLL